MATDRQTESTRHIEDILRGRKSSLADQVASAGDTIKLARDIRESIVSDELSSEFCEKDLQSDDEPNKYGPEIENLIDACGLSRFEK